MRIRKDPQVRRKEIIEGSTALFIENGYEETTVEDILQKLGIARGCFYHYFRSKEEVFAESIASIAGMLIERYRRILENPERTPGQRLVEYIDEAFRSSQERQDLMLAIHAQEFEAMHDQVMKESIHQMLPVFTRLIEEGRTVGEFRAENAEFAAAALLGAFREIHDHYANLPAARINALREPTIGLVECILQARLR